MHFKAAAPAEWSDHWNSLPNSVRALYATFELKVSPFTRKEVEIEAWGQLCFDDAACNAVAFHMHNKKMQSWQFISWRCVMHEAPKFGKLNGTPPDDFDIYNYINI